MEAGQLGISSSAKPRIGITAGDLHGIGCEVIIKALHDGRLLKHLQPILYAPAQAIAYYCQILSIHSLRYEVISHIEEAKNDQIYLVDSVGDLPKELELRPGVSTRSSAMAALYALEAAVQDLKGGRLHGLATGPIAKYAMQDIGFPFAGHTEYLAHAFDAPEALMMMVSEHMRIALASTHVPLMNLGSTLNAKVIEKKVCTLFHALEYDFGIAVPKIAILGINPHAGENGQLAKEEQEWILPLVAKVEQEENKYLMGPYAADSFFATGAYQGFDAVLAMYHDQGLIPFKMLSFDTGVNYTAGMPVLRTSPDHGTAFDIAGKNKASEKSMREALFLLCQIIGQRKNIANIEK